MHSFLSELILHIIVCKKLVNVINDIDVYYFVVRVYQDIVEYLRYKEYLSRYEISYDLEKN